MWQSQGSDTCESFGGPDSREGLGNSIVPNLILTVTRLPLAKAATRTRLCECEVGRGGTIDLFFRPTTQKRVGCEIIYRNKRKLDKMRA